MTNKPPNPQNATAPVGEPGWSEFVEDTIGINLRGLRTIAAAFINPARLFAAARQTHWNGGEFSPTLRVWLFLTAIVMFFQFIWASPDSYIGDQMLDFLKTMPATSDADGLEDLRDVALQRYVFVYPIILLIITTLSGALLRIWGPRTSVVTRTRLFFAAILPGAFIVSVSTPLLYFFLTSNGQQLAGLLFIVIFIADFITTLRGLGHLGSVSGRFWRSLMLAATSQIANLVASTLALIVMVFWVVRDQQIAVAMLSG